MPGRTCKCLRWALSTRAQAEPSYRKATRMMPSCWSRLAEASASPWLGSCQSLLSMVMGKGVLSGTTANRMYLHRTNACHWKIWDPNIRPCPAHLCLSGAMNVGKQNAQQQLWKTLKPHACSDKHLDSVSPIVCVGGLTQRVPNE